MMKWILPLLLTLAALLVFSAAARRHPLGTYATETDFYHYYGPDAARLAAGEFPENPYQGPGYPALVALVAKFTGDAFTAGKWISVFCAALVLLLIYLLFARLGNQWIGAGAALLAGLAPQFPQFAVSASTDVFFLLLALAAIVALLEDRLPSWARVALAGALSGLAYLTRYNGVFLVVAVLFALLALDLFSASWRDRVKWAVVFIGVFLLTVSPWLWANYRHRGSPLYNANYLNLATEFYPELVDGRWNQDGTRPLEGVFGSFTDVISYDPKRVLLHYPRNLYESLRLSLTSDLVSPWVGWAALAGILIALFERRSRAHSQTMMLVLVSALLYVLLMGLNHWETRYYFFLMAIYSGMAVYAVARALEWSRGRGYLTHRFYVLIPVALIAVLAWKSFVMARSDLTEFLGNHPTEVVAACDYLRSQGISNARVVARKPHLPYICGQQWVFFPETKSIEELGEWLKTHEVDYLSFGVREVKSRPELKPLRDVRKAPPWLRVVWRNEDPPLILYRPEF